MSTFKMHDIDSAPADSRDVLQKTKDSKGFVPNLFAYMAAAPNVLNAYNEMNRLFGESTLSEAHQQLILLRASVENDCEFCTAAHTAGAKEADLSEETIDSILNKGIPGHPHDAALADFVAKVVRERGNVSDAQVKAFLEAGFTQANVHEVLLGVAMKTLSNYTNHIMHTELNDELKQS